MGRISYDFEDAAVIVTGGARGIGRAICEAFGRAGASVWMVDADADALRSAAPEVGANPACVDVRDTASVEQLVTEVVTDRGRIDVLVNNAGALRDGMLWKTSDEDWDLVVDVSLGGTFRVTRACVPHFRAQSRGRVINVTSFTGLHGNIGQAAYAAAKAGVIGFTKTAAKELAGFGVTVNAISPNAQTRMIDSIPEDRRREIEATIPMGRFGAPAEISSGVLFLASEEAGYITGAVVAIDGGISM
jgi:3-oxoacyl-[acyl-carrier protein] reductase